MEIIDLHSFLSFFSILDSTFSFVNFDTSHPFFLLSIVSFLDHFQTFLSVIYCIFCLWCILCLLKHWSRLPSLCIPKISIISFWLLAIFPLLSIVSELLHLLHAMYMVFLYVDRSQSQLCQVCSSFLRSTPNPLISSYKLYFSNIMHLKLSVSLSIIYYCTAYTVKFPYLFNFDIPNV